MEKMERDITAKRVYVGKCAGIRSVEKIECCREGLFKGKRFGCQESKEDGGG